jgi:hypothetical protein
MTYHWGITADAFFKIPSERDKLVRISTLFALSGNEATRLTSSKRLLQQCPGLCLIMTHVYKSHGTLERLVGSIQTGKNIRNPDLFEHPIDWDTR